MTGYTFAEKVLARAAGVNSARVGDILDVKPDIYLSHDNTAPIRKIFEKIGAPKVLHPERMAITLDHAVPAPTTEHAQNHAEIREWVKSQGAGHFFEVGRGICHQVHSEEAVILPGEVVMGSDSHTPHFGWMGAFGMGLGRTEIAAIWATGELWLRVPETFKVVLTGKPRPGVTAKDVTLRLMKDKTVGGGQYRAIEITGDTVQHWSIDELPVMPNMMAEFGAMCAYIAPDERVLAYIEERRKKISPQEIKRNPYRMREYNPIYPDADAVYDEVYTLDVSDLQPQIALPHLPDNVVNLEQAIGTPIQQALIGTCTGGRLSDMHAAAEVVRGKQVACRFVVIPASSQVLLDATKDGTLATLLEAGVTISTPGCGPCMGNHQGVPAPNEATIMTGSRNFKGRLGTNDSTIYLSNPYVVAASALAGAIADPQSFI
ncbi:MAG: 3-isopropylmalate dehydratase large subunit [Anaerolineae bacterium]|nr:3-isopropylmalate dehydratase large subunit [Anaerolineae bacterium]